MATALNWIWDNSERLSHLATICTGLLTVVVVGAAILQIQKSRESQERATAFELYSQFLIQTLQHPEYAVPKLAPKDVEKGVWPGKSGTFELYEAYVDLMIVAFEELLSVKPQDDIDIEGYFASYLDTHKAYLRSKKFGAYERHMAPEFQKFLNEWKSAGALHYSKLRAV